MRRFGSTIFLVVLLPWFAFGHGRFDLVVYHARALGVKCSPPTPIQGNRAVAVRNDSTSAGQWMADLELVAGTNTLAVYADHPSGQWTTNASSTFTLTNKAVDALQTTFDGAGNVTQRIWKNATNGTARTQTLTWEGFNRLSKVSDRDSQNQGYDWSTIFDGLGRRALTQIALVSNNVATVTNTIRHYYDPRIEFLEIGVAVNGTTTWKLYGPDGDGAYGRQQGLGGLELLDITTPGGSSHQTGVIQDHFGNVLAGTTGSSVQWVAARLSAYGPLEGTQLPVLAVQPLSIENLAWRGKWRDVTGTFYWGARPYDPEAGRFLGADPFGHGSDPSLYGFCNGDPINRFDADGRCSNPSQQNTVSAGSVFGANGGNINANDLLTWGMQNPNASINGSDNASGWMAAGQAMANGTVSNPQYINGYTDQFGRNYASFCYSCHDPNDPIAQLKLGAAYNTVNTSIPAFLAQNALAFMPAEGMIGEAGAVLNGVRTTLAGPTANWANYLAAEARIGTTPATLAEIQDAIRLNAGIADNAAVGTPRTFGRFGTAAHNEFESLNNQLNADLQASGSQFSIATEQFRDAAGSVVGRRAAGSLGVDAVVNQNGAAVLGMDLKTGAAWSANALNQIQTRFNNIPVIQIRTGP